MSIFKKFVDLIKNKKDFVISIKDEKHFNFILKVFKKYYKGDVSYNINNDFTEVQYYEFEYNTESEYYIISSFYNPFLSKYKDVPYFNNVKNIYLAYKIDTIRKCLKD